ncbi:unnamed protein product [Mytilus coruscus]|uniref:CCHC-type domain-containing protein n=1 Tax=Mytilus coruscus TaxID=42192 RepID=A0A6J8AT73_MYTCO|nr:unnamed protein product [Mytilus coruscus]
MPLISVASPYWVRFKVSSVLSSVDLHLGLWRACFSINHAEPQCSSDMSDNPALLIAIGVSVFAVKMTDLLLPTGKTRLEIGTDYLNWGWYIGIAAIVTCIKAGKEATSEKKSPIKPKQHITIENKQIQQLTARINQLTTESQAMRQTSDESNKEQIRWRRIDTYQQPDETILHRPLYHNEKRTPRSETICWRCKQPGHYAIECTVRLDHSRKTPGHRRTQPPKDTPTKVISDVETVTDSEDESFVVMWHEPESEKETDVIVPSHDEIDTVPDEIEVSGNVDDDQVRTSEPDSDSVEDAHDADDDELQIQDQNEENDEAPTIKYKDCVAKSAQKADWMIRAEYLKSAASSGIFSKYGDDVSKAMLKLIMKSDD